MVYYPRVRGYGIPEYWRFDSSGGLFRNAALAGDRLVEGEYRRIPIEAQGGPNCRGYSTVLGLWLCWEDGQLRWFDSESSRYLRTHDEEYERRRAELCTLRAELCAEYAKPAPSTPNCALGKRRLRANKSKPTPNKKLAHTSKPKPKSNAYTPNSKP